MATIIELESGFAVAPQLVADDFAEIAAAGFVAVVNNRPDGEEEGQLPAEEARKHAELNGLSYYHLPFHGFDVSDEEMVDEFIALAEKLEGPVLYYCRTGTRCTLLWAQYAVTHLGVDAVSKIARTAGYDVSVVIEELETRALAVAEAA